MKQTVKIQLVMNVGFNDEKSCKMHCLLKINNPAFKGTNYGVVELEPKHQLKPNTATILALSQGKIFNLEGKKKSDKVVLDNINAEFVKGHRTDGSEYYAVLCNLNNSKTRPMMRIFYLDDPVINAVKDYGCPYEFVMRENQIDADEVDTNDSEE
jgi:hypothetical protein